MKKIMFNDSYGLTAAVLQGRKTMTRRIVPAQYVPMIEDGLQGAALIEAQRHGDAFRENEIVAVAQSYESIHNEMIIGDYGDSKYDAFRCAMVANNPGWLNKMFVKPSLMPHQIQITDINIERLQDISDEDCMREGIVKGNLWKPYNYTAKGLSYFEEAIEAFAELIDAVSGKDTWQSNPFVFAYSFKLIK